MNMKKVLNAPSSVDIVTIEEHVKSSELIKTADSSRIFDYELNDKATTSKLLKAAKRTPIEVEENSCSSNLVFSAGAWYHAVLSSVKYWNDVKGEKTCKIGDYAVKVSGVKLGKENNGKHVNTQIVFFADRDKVVCHLYNTTQRILINGHGYKKFIDLFLKPFLVAKINECLDDIENFNDEVVAKLGPKTVKRSNIKFKKGPAFPCHSCEYAAKSVLGLKKHKKNEHILSFNSSNKMLEPRQSTRNNSVIENLMIEDITVTDMSNDSVDILQENVLKYTCKECNFATTSKSHIDGHVKSKHLADKNEEVRFVCIICKHEFSEVDDYNSHVKAHERITMTRMMHDKDEEIAELENIVFCYILEDQIKDMEDEKLKSKIKSGCNLSCNQCEFETDNDVSLKGHMQITHKSAKVKLAKNILKIKCNQCSYECKLNIQMKKHVEIKHVEKLIPDYKCNLCDFGANFITEIWNHKLDNHAGETFNVNKFDESAKYNLIFNLVAEQNVDLMEEVTNLKNGIKEVLEQLINEFEDNMKSLKNEVRIQNAETTKVILDLKNTIIKTENKSPSVSENCPPSSSSTSKASAKPSPSASSVPPPKASWVKNCKPKKITKTEYQRRPRVLMIGDSIAHNTNFRKLEAVTNVTIKTSKAYSSAWDKDAKFKHLNVTDVVKTELEKAPFDHLLLAAPTVDITNLDASKSKPTDTTDIFKQNVGTSCQNMIKAAEDALANHPGLKKVTIMNHAPRFDTKDVDPVCLKSNLASFANSYLLELWLDSPQKNKIFIGSHNLECSVSTRNMRYRDERTGRYDGVHMYGYAGKTAYTESVLNILLSTLQPQAPAPAQQCGDPAFDDYHTRCPQAKYMRGQKKMYSAAVAGNGPIKTQNRFSPLGNY